MSTDNILNLGDDQLANQYIVLFPTGIPGGGNTDTISLRMDQSFDPPEETVNTYDIIFQGLKITKTGMLTETTKEFTIDIRLDQQWKVFDDLNNWFKKVYDPIKGTALPDIMVRTTVVIQYQDGQNKVVKNMRFTGVKIKSLKVGTADHTSGDPIRLTLGFIYVDKIEE